jgi:uncharacterized protein (DUF1697 family)
VAIHMTRYIAFLRAINVGGHIVKMNDLRKIFESLGFVRVETFIASGNVIFETNISTSAKLEQKIEVALLKALGYEVHTFLRTDSEVAAIAQYKPFHESELKSAGAFCVGFLASPMEKDAQKIFMNLKNSMDDFHYNNREIYWLCKMKQSESTFSNAAFEKALKVRSTFRGFNTILRLAAKFPPAR